MSQKSEFMIYDLNNLAHAIIGKNIHVFNSGHNAFCVFPSLDLKNKWHLVVDRLTVLFLKFLEYFHKLQLFIWWLLEIHIIKIVSCYIVLVSLKEVWGPVYDLRSYVLSKEAVIFTSYVVSEATELIR